MDTYAVFCGVCQVWHHPPCPAARRRQQERRTDDKKDGAELSLDPEYQRLVGVKIATEAEWHQAVLIRHRAYEREQEAAAAKVKANSDLEKYLQSKRFDK